MIFQSINPNDQSLVAEHEVMTDKQVQQALDKAEHAFTSWKTTSFTHRADLMHKVAAVLREKKEYYARLITSEMGKVLKESLGEVEKSAGNCDYYAENAERFLGEEPIASEAHRSSIVFDPMGCVFAIMPWNFPFWQVLRYSAKALMAGNVTLLKHAPNVCGCSKAIAEAFEEAGFPEGVFQSVIVDVPQVEGIIAANIVQGITFTGSEKAGAAVGALAGKHIKKSVLELGGSDAFIVLEDADVTKAAEVAVRSRMLNAGQACNVAKRFIAVKPVANDFLHEIEQKIKGLVQGDPLEGATDLGPLARIDLAENLGQQLDRSITGGAQALIHGSQHDCHVSPSLLTGVKPGQPAFDEETFGPLAAVIEVDHEAEAIKMANHHRYGLDATLWTKDLDKAAHIARRLEAGGVFVNTMVRSDSRFPFGGVKKSGYGRELSAYGLKEFVNIKALVIDE